LFPAFSENGLATEKGLKVMVETLGIAVGKELMFRPGDWSITACSARCNRTLEFRDDLRKLTHLDLVERRPVKSKNF
jgi:hypothetical protein